MQDDLERRVEERWNALQQKYQWHFVAVRQSVIQAAVHDLHNQPESTASQIDVIIIGHQSAALYGAIVTQRQQPHDLARREAANLACQDVYRMVYGCRYLSGYSDDIREQIAQTVMERLIAHPEKVNEPKALVAWLCSQVQDARKPIMRDKQRITPLETDADEQPTHEPDSEDFSNLVVTREVVREINGILSPFQQQVIELTIFQDLKPREAAAILQTTSHHISVEKSRALEVIRKYLAGDNNE